MSLRDDIETAIDQLTALFNEMQHTSDRVAAVSCAASVDDALRAVLATRFVNIGKTWEGRIFEGPTSPLGTFSAKAITAYALGLFGPLTFADLELIRKVRNHFAHTAHPVSFTDADIADKCRRLTAPRRIAPGIGIAFPLEDPPSPKALYVRSAQHIAGRLIGWGRIHRPPRPQPPIDVLP